MSIDDTLHSGSRWEPVRTPTAVQPQSSDDATPVPGAYPTADLPDTAHPHTAHPGDGTTDPAATSRPRSPAARRVLAAVAAVAILLAGGLGGFALGRTTAGDGAAPADSGFTVPADGNGVPGGRPDFGNGTLPDGTLPGGGTLPEGVLPQGTLPDGSLPDGTQPAPDDANSSGTDDGTT